jgi:hypothetical protein
VRLESIEDNRALFIMESGERSSIALGKSDSEVFYWQIIPNHNATTFTFKNLKTGDFLSSRIKRGCRRHKWGVFWCTESEIYNQGHPLSNRDSQKWVILR